MLYTLCSQSFMMQKTCPKKVCSKSLSLGLPVVTYEDMNRNVLQAHLKPIHMSLISNGRSIWAEMTSNLHKTDFALCALWTTVQCFLSGFDNVLSEDMEPGSGVLPQQKGNCVGGKIRPNGNGFTQHLGPAGLLVHTVWCDQSVLHEWDTIKINKYQPHTKPTEREEAELVNKWKQGWGQGIQG